MSCSQNTGLHLKGSLDDLPIARPEEDKHSFNTLAKSIATGISEQVSPNGFVIAITGSWGSGKSSMINLIRHHLENSEKEDNLKIFDFKCWWFRGPEALTVAFFQELHANLGQSSDIKDKLLDFGKAFLPLAVNIGGSLLGLHGEKLEEAISKFFADDENVEKLHKDLSGALKDAKKRYLVIIDDIDRLAPDDALLMFRFVKSVGQLPNVCYLLAYDRAVAEKVVSEKYPSEGSHYLEKIVQTSFEVPIVRHDVIFRELRSPLSSILDDMAPEDADRFSWYQESFLRRLIQSPRDVIRLANTLTFEWPAVKDNVNPCDFICMEILRIHKPKLYRAIKDNPNIFLNLLPEEEIQTDISAYNLILFDDRDSEQDKQNLVSFLQNLFPDMCSKGEGPRSTHSRYIKGKRVAAPECFEAYFRFAPSKLTLSGQDWNQIRVAAMEGNKGQLETLFSGQMGSGVNFGNEPIEPLDLIFGALKTYADELDYSEVETILRVIFKKADNFCGRPCDQYEPYHIIWPRMTYTVRALVRQFDQSQRSDLIFSACSGATLSWLVHFVKLSEPNAHHMEQDRATESDPWLPLDTHAEIKSYAISRTRKAIADGSILEAPQFISVLYRFKEMVGNNNELRLWLKSIDSDTLVMLCSKLMQLSESSNCNPVAKASNDLFEKDLSEYIEAAINSKSLPKNAKTLLSEFIEQLRKPEAHADPESASLGEDYDIATQGVNFYALDKQT